jgi:UDP-N-acetylmuramoyl-L-alanyl-D-glutamate--2,6-diaminopimelate ligase
MMQIDSVLKGMDVISLSGDITRIISGIEFDSRKVVAGSLFVAVKGYSSDGHDFINAAVLSGAYAVIMLIKISAG